MLKQSDAFDALKIAGFFQPCFCTILKYPNPNTFSSLHSKENVSMSLYRKTSQAYDLRLPL